LAVTRQGPVRGQARAGSWQVSGGTPGEWIARPADVNPDRHDDKKRGHRETDQVVTVLRADRFIGAPL